MKFLLGLLVVTLATEVCQDLQAENQMLQASLDSLKQQLQGLNPDSVYQSFIESKEKLNSLIREFTEDNSRISLAQDIRDTLAEIAAEIKYLNYSPEDVNEEQVREAIKVLEAAISKSQIFSQNKEFSKLYNQLIAKSDESNEIIRNLQVENAELIGKLEGLKANYEALQSTYENEQELRRKSEQELSNLKIQHSDRIDIIEKSLTAEERALRSEETGDFLKISNSQNSLISELQLKNSQLILSLEQKTTEISNYDNDLTIEKARLANMKAELDARDKQLFNCEDNFDGFRRKVELENNGQISAIKESQENLQKELKQMHENRQELMGSLNNCSQELAQVKVEDQLKENVIESLRNDLKHQNESVDSAKDAREKEMGLLDQDIKDLKDTLKQLQKQYDEALDRIASQSKIIREYEEKISDYEYVAQRNLRG